MISSGIGDPYWYEWFVGVDYILDMLYHNSPIMSVTFQASDVEGIDDVIVSYFNGKSRCIQVKHSRIGETLSFRDFFSGSNSWIVKMALGWVKMKDSVTECVPVLYTNRKNSTYNSKEFASLDRFFKYIKAEIEKVSTLDDISISKEYENNWKECIKELQVLGSDKIIFQFLKCICIEDNQFDIEEKKDEIKNKLKTIFGLTNQKQIQELYNSICGALSEWTISTRKKENINREEVYKKLSIPDKSKIEEHQLPTPYPFFESRKNLIQKLTEVINNNEYPVIFLSGNPGCGKSSIISNLANNRDSVISFRYHAFIPITPDTKEIIPDYDDKVSDAKLWGDILDQIRLKLENKLALYEVPIRNDILTPSQLRNHVLRLLEIIHKEEERTICVAIDGIDHAARASREDSIENNFLRLLVPPDDVPEGVCFLIAGQKAQGYEEYPDWLKVKRNDVLQLNVPQLEIEDVKRLLECRNIEFSNNQNEEMARIIYDIAEGNTLQCIFAIYEAIRCSSVSELENKLKDHKLHDGLIAYYKEIWESVIHKLKKNALEAIPYIDSKLAAYLCISKSLYNPDVLQILLMDIKFGNSESEQVLDDLYPLVIRNTSNSFILIHNDVRVFLKGELYNKQNVLVDIASTLADIYINNTIYINERHYEVFDLLSLANRSNEFLKIFTPEFIIEAISINQPLEQIEKISEELICVLRDNCDTKLLAQFSATINTLNKVKETKKYLRYVDNYDTTNNNINVPAVLYSEKKNKFSQCERHEFFTILEDIKFLIKNNAIDRAATLISRWFNKNSLLSIAEYYWEDRYIEFYKDCGKVFFYVNFDFDSILSESTQYAKRIYNYIVIGVLKEIILKEDLKCFIIKFNKYYPNISDTMVEELLILLAQSNKWKEVSYILKKIQNREMNIKSSILYQFLFVLCSDPHKCVENYGLTDIQFNEIDLIKYASEENLLIVLLAFIKGVNNCNVKEIINESLEYYYQNKRDIRYKDSFESLIISAVQLGKLYNEVMSKNEFVNVLECCKNITNTIYKIDNSTATHIKDCFRIRNIFLRICIYCVKQTSNDSYISYIDWLLVFILMNSNISHEIEIILDNVNKIDNSKVNFWLDQMSQQNGIIWDSNAFVYFSSYDIMEIMAKKIEKNISVITMFIRMAEKYNLIDIKNTLISNLKRKWLLICNTYIDVSDIIRYLHVLLVHYPEYWNSKGLIIYRTISKHTSKDLIEKVSREILLAAWKCGYGEFEKSINCLNLLKSELNDINDYLCIYDVIYEIIKTMRFSEEDLICIYGLVIGGLPWRDKDVRRKLYEIIHMLKKIANQNGFLHLQKAMEVWDNADFNQNIKTLKDNDMYVSYFGTHIEKDKVGKIKELSIDVLFNEFLICNNPVYSKEKVLYAIELANRVNESSADKYFSYKMNLYDFSKELYQKVFQIEYYILEFFELLFHVLKKISYEQLLFNLLFDIENELSIMSKVLDRLLLASSKYEKKENILECIDYRINMICVWTDEEHKTDFEITKNIKVANNISLLDTVIHFCITMLDNASIIHNESGLQGLYFIINNYPKTIKTIAVDWSHYSEKVQIYLLKILIRVIIYNEYDSEILMDVVKKSLNSKNILVREKGLLCYLIQNKSNKKSAKLKLNGNLLNEYRKIKDYYIQIIYNEAEDIYNIDLPKFVSNINWPNSYFGVGVDKNTQDQIENNLKKCIHDSISDNAIVLSAILHYYGLIKSYIYCYTLDNLKFDLLNTVFSSFEMHKTPCISQIIMTPSKKFMKKFHLKYSSTSPFVLTQNGKKVVWLEFIYGAIGEEEAGYFRKNMVQRWVCTNEFYRSMEKRFNGINFISELIETSESFNYNSLPNDVYIFE